MTTECTDECLTQNAYYCGYDCDTMVKNVFAYRPDCKVLLCAINFTGSWADGTLMQRLLQNIKKQIGEYEIWVDQGFPHSGEAAGIVVGLVPQQYDCIEMCKIGLLH